jgi:hypothetical protein
MFACLTRFLGSSRSLFQFLAALGYIASSSAAASSSQDPALKSLLDSNLWIGSTLKNPRKVTGGIPGHEPPPKSVPNNS